MNGRELVLATLRRENTPRVPWVPFTGVHIGSLRGYGAKELLLDSDKLVECGLVANRMYRADGQPVVFDLQLEAEALGCNLQWANEAPPSVSSHPLEQGYELLDQMVVPQPDDGRFPIVLDAMKRLKAAIGDRTALYGLVCGPLTLALHLRGTSIFLDMFDEPCGLKKLIRFCREVAESIAGYYAEAGMDVIAVVDPMISQISPPHFRAYVKEESRQLFDSIRSLGVYSSYFVCGNATPLLEEMASCGPDGISVDENVSMEEAREVAEHYGIAYGGNIPLTKVLLFGQPVDAMRMALDLMENCGGPGFILSPGCDMPYGTRPDNVSACSMAVLEPEKAREFVNMEKSRELEDVEVDMPDYAALARPLIEIFTIDSATCPPCRYMVDAARVVAKEVGDVDWIEHKCTMPETVARMKRLGIRNLPTIVINGKIAFASLIPDLESFKTKVKEVMRT